MRVIVMLIAMLGMAGLQGCVPAIALGVGAMAGMNAYHGHENEQKRLDARYQRKGEETTSKEMTLVDQEKARRAALK